MRRSSACQFWLLTRADLDEIDTCRLAPEGVALEGVAAEAAASTLTEALMRQSWQGIRRTLEGAG